MRVIIRDPKKLAFLSNFFQMLKKYDNEVILKFNHLGLAIQLVDSSHSCMADAFFQAKGFFDDYDFSIDDDITPVPGAAESTTTSSLACYLPVHLANLTDILISCAARINPQNEFALVYNPREPERATVTLTTNETNIWVRPLDAFRTTLSLLQSNPSTSSPSTSNTTTKTPLRKKRNGPIDEPTPNHPPITTLLPTLKKRSATSAPIATLDFHFEVPLIQTDYEPFTPPYFNYTFEGSIRTASLCDAVSELDKRSHILAIHCSDDKIVVSCKDAGQRETKIDIAWTHFEDGCIEEDAVFDVRFSMKHITTKALNKSIADSLYWAFGPDKPACFGYSFKDFDTRAATASLNTNSDAISSDVPSVPFQEADFIHTVANIRFYVSPLMDIQDDC